MITHATLGALVGENLTIRLPKHDIEKLKNFKEGDLCRVEIKRPKDKRSLEQNRYIWEIISQIDKRVNGYISDIWNIYLQVIQEAGIQREIEYIEKSKIEELKKRYRVVSELQNATVITSDGKRTEIIICACLKGTSQFTKAEMSDFIEVLITRAYAEGIDVLQYEEILRGGR